MRRSILPLMLCIAVAACSGPESRTREGLIKAGLSPKMADCMAPRMADRLSITQLSQLAAVGKGVGKGAGEERGKNGLKHVMKRLRDLDDPEILSVVSSSAALCATGFGL